MSDDPSAPLPALQKQHYSDDQAKEILARAMAQPGDDGFSAADLAQVAGELGIAPAQLEAAERAWLAERGADEERQLRRHFITVRRREARNGLIGLATAGTLVWLAITFSIPLLATIAAVVQVPLAFIGIFLFFQAWEAFAETEGKDFDKAFDKWLERRQRRRALIAPPRAREEG